MYTYGWGICEGLKKDLMENNNLENSPFKTYIRIIYSAIKLNSYKKPGSQILYSGAYFENHEIEEFISNKARQNEFKVSAKKFISSSEEKQIAVDHKNNHNYNVLLIIKINNNCLIDDKITTFTNIEEISELKVEREVSFFPFSLFKVLDIKKIKENDYEITLSYLDIMNPEDSKIKGKKNETEVIQFKFNWNYVLYLSLFIIFISIVIIINNFLFLSLLSS